MFNITSHALTDTAKDEDERVETKDLASLQKTILSYKPARLERGLAPGYNEA